MSLEAHLAPLTRAELVSLIVNRCWGIEERDIAAARWESASAEARRLDDIAGDLADKASLIADQCTLSNSRENLKRMRERDDARHLYRVASARAETARRRETKRWDELQAFTMKAAK